MKLLNNIKGKSFRKSKRDSKSLKDVDALALAPPSASEPEGSSSAPVTPSPVKESRDLQNESAGKSSLRRLQLGSFDFDKSYAFPPLHSEASSMLELSLLIYVLSELRDLGKEWPASILAVWLVCSYIQRNSVLISVTDYSSFVCTARNGVVNNPSKSLRILEMPLPLQTAYNIIYGEADLLQEVLNDGKHDATLSALRSMLKKRADVKVVHNETVVKEEDRGGMFSGWMDSWNGCLAGGFSFDELCGDVDNVDHGRHIAVEKDNTESSMIYYVGDVNSSKELVYAINVNSNEERITVAFRGSVTKVDFAADANINMMYVAEPSLDLVAVEDGEHEIGLHQGFYEYLFNSSGSKSNFDQILEHVQKLFKQDTNRQRHYKLYITGHGSGGALASLFGYYCAASSSRNQLPLPVTVVSVASPKVGDLAFARSFTELESQAKLRHLRIAAYKDPMNLVPVHSSNDPLPLGMRNSSPLCALAFNDSFSCDSNDVYCHTGVVMKLRNDIPAVTSQRVEIAYSGASYMSRAPALKSLSTLDSEELVTLLDEAKVSGSKKSDVYAIAQYHFGEAYSDRLELVDKDLRGFTLNRIYHERANIDHLIN